MNETDMASDRRAWFRVADRVYLQCRRLNSTDPKKQRGSVVDFDARTEVLGELQVLDFQMQGLADRVKKEAPLAAQMIALMEQKIGLLAMVLLGEADGFLTEPRVQVDLGGGGLGFDSETAYVVDEWLGLTLVLFPELATIRAEGRVVSCTASADHAVYRTAVEFSALAEADQDRLLEHILNVQGQEIRQHLPR